MRIASLRLSGFKSFVEATELPLRDGLTGVVGPNGCGKSNLVEALRWAMGENSARSLRVGPGGSGMDEVIFAGTARRPGRDLAEVRIRLDNSARSAPAAFNGHDEIEVARAIVRGEGSTYAINGREVRARDVQLLFADAASGAHSPALVSQGRVAALIAQRPHERRQLLEDAAGIAGLNVRRREAEQRLRAADQNLARLDDLMQASEAQAQALRRQARAAERYRRLSAEIRALEAREARRSWSEAVAALLAAERDLAAVEARLEQAIEAAARASTAQAEGAATLPGLRQAEAAAAALLQRFATERATLMAERAAVARRIADLDQAIDASAADEDREAGRARDAAATQDRLGCELQAQRAALARAETDLPAATAAAADNESQTTMAERALARAIEAHAAILADARSARAQAEATAARAARIEGERLRLATELERQNASGSGAALDRQVAETESELARLSAAAEAAAAAIAAAERAAAAARQAGERVGRALAAARAEVAGLEAEAAALDRLRAGAARGGDARSRVRLEAQPGYEAALAAALGEDAGAALGPQDPPQRHWLALAAADDPALPPDVAPLAPHVSAPAALGRRLAQVGLVDSPPDAARMARLAPGQRLVSRDGWMWRWDGLVAPPGGAAAAVAELLAQDNRRREIDRALEAPRARVAAAQAEAAAQARALADAEAAERAARAQRAEADGTRDRLAGRLQGLRAAQAQAAARRSALAASIERLAAEGADASREADEAEAKVASLPDTGAAAEAVGSARQAAERARAMLAGLRAEAAGLERAVGEARARIHRLERELADWKARDAAAAETRQALADRRARLIADRAALVAEPAALDARLAALDERIGAAERDRQAAADAVMAAELTLQDLDRQARTGDAEVANAREARAGAAARVGQLRERVAERVAATRETFGVAPDALEPAADDEDDSGLLEERIRRLHAERERIGIVNLRADIELAEIEDTLARQRAERAELETAIRRLRGSIGTLNGEGRQRLQAAFQTVDAHFRDLFTRLFGGGAAELQLVDSDDPLEAGLEIRAQPPGKKLQSLTLLSGGEQALTAIALIFALFQTNPAPVCVLDEVDAPLDDANVARFTHLLRHMADTTTTRFLVVTHNAVTMAAMDRLFGVTMAEPGVSQLVSVALAEAEALAA